MGVIPPVDSPSLSPNLTPASPLSPAIVGNKKRQSMRLEDAFKNLKPLPPPSSQSGFLGFRESNGTNGGKKKKTGKKERTIDSDDDDSDKERNAHLLGSGHNLRNRTTGELTEEEARVEEGLRKMKVFFIMKHPIHILRSILM